MPIEEAHKEAWMKIGGMVKIMIENEYLQKTKEQLEEIRQNYCSCEQDRMCITCDMFEEILCSSTPVKEE